MSRSTGTGANTRALEKGSEVVDTVLVMTLPPDPEAAPPQTRSRTIISVLLLVLAAMLVPVVFLAGFAWPIFEALECQSSCDASWTGPIVIWVIGAALVGGLTFLGVRGIVRPTPLRSSQQDG
jgi:amino acid transporter